MQPKLIRMQHGEYVARQWNGQNTSGIIPHDDRVLVLTDLFADVTSGGIFITDEQRERHNLASQTGILIAAGENAWLWNSDRSRRSEGKKPEPGQRVIFEQYAGTLLWGADGERYRLLDDKCIGGLFSGNIPVAEAKPRLRVPAVTKVKTPPLVLARGA